MQELPQLVTRDVLRSLEVWQDDKKGEPGGSNSYCVEIESCLAGTTHFSPASFLIPSDKIIKRYADRRNNRYKSSPEKLVFLLLELTAYNIYKSQCP